MKTRFVLPICLAENANGLCNFTMLPGAEDTGMMLASVGKPDFGATSAVGKQDCNIHGRRERSSPQM